VQTGSPEFVAVPIVIVHVLFGALVCVAVAVHVFTPTALITTVTPVDAL